MRGDAAALVRDAVQRSRRRVLAGERPMVEPRGRRDGPFECACGNQMFWDADVERWLCPGRYDGAAVHSRLRVP